MIYSTILKLHPRSPSSRTTELLHLIKLCVVLCNICMQYLFNNCASCVQYLSISLLFVQHFQGGATQICVFLCISEFAHAPRCVFEVLPMMASRQGCFVVFSVFWLDPGRKTLFSELCNICAIFHKYLLDNENISAMIVQYLECVVKVFVSSN